MLFNKLENGKLLCVTCKRATFLGNKFFFEDIRFAIRLDSSWMEFDDNKNEI